MALATIGSATGDASPPKLGGPGKRSVKQPLRRVMTRYNNLNLSQADWDRIKAKIKPIDPVDDVSADDAEKTVPVEIDGMGKTVICMMTPRQAARHNEDCQRFADRRQQAAKARRQASARYREKPTAVRREALLEAIDLCSRYCSSDQRADTLIPSIASEPPEVFWPAFVRNWPMCDLAAPWNDRVLELMRKNAPALPYLDEVQNEEYTNLPPGFEVWRGADRSTVRHFSWTTDPKKAEFFAVHRRGAAFPDPVVAHAFISKAHVFYFEIARGEFEVLLDPRRLRKLTVESIRQNKKDRSTRAERALADKEAAIG